MGLRACVLPVTSADADELLGVVSSEIKVGTSGPCRVGEFCSGCLVEVEVRKPCAQLSNTSGQQN